MRELREPAGSRPDLVGAGLFSVTVAALTVAIVKGQAWGWSSAQTVGVLAASAILLAAVAWRSAVHPAPLIEPVIVRTRAIALANLGALLFLTAFGAVWFRTHMGSAPHYTSEMLPAQLLTGAGVGLIVPTLSAAATGPLPPARFATGTAVLGMSRRRGSALGVAPLVAIIGHPGPAGVIAAFRDGWTFIIVLALAAGTALFSVGPVTIGGPEPAAAMAPAAPESSPA